MLRKILTPSRIILLGYIGIILIGAILLNLPISTHTPHSFIDSVFTSTSGVCVTGLIVKDTPNDFTRFGKAVILILIQLGGLGYMTITSFLFIILGRRLSIRQTAITEEAMTYPFGGIGKFVLQVVKLTIGFELIGALILAWRFATLGVPFPLAQGIFHSVSAFCNAGFALFSQSLIDFVNDPWIIITMSILIITGGIGFIVLRDLYDRIRGHKPSLTLHTKLVLISTVILITIGTVIILIAEWDNVLKDFLLGGKLLCSFFQSVTTRTAGFQVVNISEYKLGTCFLTIILMFIGASPGGTGGGIKTTTAMLIFMSIYAYFRRKEVGGFGRRVENLYIMRAFVIAAISIGIIILGVLVISFADPGKSFISLLFEEVSAFGTVGLSMGSRLNPACSLSYEFTNLSKIVIILTMIAGRVGSLTLGVAILQPVYHPTVKLPKDIVLTG